MILAVAGGTGVVGRLVVEAARAAGHEVRVVSRSRGADLVTGTGLATALAGADTVVDVTNSPGAGKAAAATFFRTATRTLPAAEQQAGVGPHPHPHPHPTPMITPSHRGDHGRDVAVVIISRHPAHDHRDRDR